MRQQKWLKLSLIAFCALASANVFAGHGAWKGGGSGTPAKRAPSQAEVTKMNENDFISSLSPYHRKKFMNFSQAQKRAAMLYMEKNNMSPDNAIEQALRDHIYKR